MSTSLLNDALKNLEDNPNEAVPTRRFLLTIEVETVYNEDLTADTLADLETTLVANALGFFTVVDSSFVSTTEVENFEDDLTRRFLVTIEVETVDNEDLLAVLLADLEATLVATADSYAIVVYSSFVSTTEVD